MIEPALYRDQAPSAAAEGVTDWRNFAAVYGRLCPPLRPSPSDVAHFAGAMAGHDARVLLLGVTPELSVLGNDLTAIDNSPRMLSDVWIGDHPARRAVRGDWTRLPFEDSSFTAVIGDGSLNSAPGLEPDMLREIARALADGGRAVFRAFCSPDQPETLSTVRQDVVSRWEGNFHALKWRIAMALAASDANRTVAVRTILAAFDDLFPDRPELALKTGWSLDSITTIDAYAGAAHSLSFPTLAELLDTAAPYFAQARVLEGRGYPLAERCPTIVWSRD